MQWRLDRDDVVHLGFKGLKDSIELPSAATTLVNDELNLSLERSERLKPQVEQYRLIWR